MPSFHHASLVARRGAEDRDAALSLARHCFKGVGRRLASDELQTHRQVHRPDVLGDTADGTAIDAGFRDGADLVQRDPVRPFADVGTRRSAPRLRTKRQPSIDRYFTLRPDARREMIELSKSHALLRGETS